MRRGIWLLVLAVLATGCGRLEHRFGYVDPPGTPFRVWLSVGSGAGAVVVDNDQVAVAWFGSNPGAPAGDGAQGAQVAWAVVTRDRGPCGAVRIGDEVRGDLPSLRLQCIVASTSLWATATFTGLGTPTSVAVAFVGGAAPTSAWGTKRGVWLVAREVCDRIAASRDTDRPHAKRAAAVDVRRSIADNHQVVPQEFVPEYFARATLCDCR